MAILVFDMGGSAVKYGVWAQDSLVSKGNSLLQILGRK